MLAIAIRSWRRRAGTILVALYGLILVAPVAALAFSGEPQLVHCLVEAQSVTAHHAPAEHDDQHHSGVAHNDHSQNEKCCGLFGVSAMAPSFDVFAIQLPMASSITFSLSESLFGRGFDRIDRPPRILLSL